MLVQAQAVIHDTDSSFQAQEELKLLVQAQAVIYDTDSSFQAQEELKPHQVLCEIKILFDFFRS